MVKYSIVYLYVIRLHVCTRYAIMSVFNSIYICTPGYVSQLCLDCM